jgi:peroxidase
MYGLLFELLSGDDRINEQPGLIIMHIVWLREHNRVAANLQTLNPTWNDEQLFQEARRVVIAEWQHILYNELLPMFLGPRYMRDFNLFPSSRDIYSNNEYDPSIDPSITNEFATAAFRMGHTLLQGILR